MPIMSSVEQRETLRARRRARAREIILQARRRARARELRWLSVELVALRETLGNEPDTPMEQRIRNVFAELGRFDPRDVQAKRRLYDEIRNIRSVG